MQNTKKVSQKVHKNLSLIQIVSKPIKLTLKRAFNTAHSSSATRTNFLIKLSLKISKQTQKKQFNQQEIVGYGQCGLPPKKPYCYLSDAQDCKKFMREFQQQWNQILIKIQQITKRNQVIPQLNQITQRLIKEVFEGVQPKYFTFIRQKIRKQTFSQLSSHYLLYQILQIFKIAKSLHIKNYQYSACRSALQFATLDFVGKFWKIQVADIIYQNQENKNQLNPKIQPNYSFYTISHQKNLNQMIKNGKESLFFTDFIKIKFNNQISELIKLLKELDNQKVGSKWIIDANASWSPEDYQLFQQSFNMLIKNSLDKNLNEKLLFIEQPFPIFQALKGTCTQSQIGQIKFKWQKIRQTTKFKIIADQSFVNVTSLQQMIPYCHGINIKMQKCGGPIEAVKILSQFPKFKQFQYLMFGSMVSTHLGCTQTFQFYKFATYFDIDGALLTSEPEITGGFEWKGHMGINKVKGNGFALNDFDIERLF